MSYVCISVCLYVLSRIYYLWCLVLYSDIYKDGAARDIYNNHKPIYTDNKHVYRVKPILDTGLNIYTDNEHVYRVNPTLDTGLDIYADNKHVYRVNPLLD